MLRKKEHLFFDLDHTLWDFETNATETLNELYFRYQFDQLFNASTSANFISVYTENNHRLWNLYHHGKIDKPTLRKLRFADTFTALGVEPALFPLQFEEEYLAICPTKTHLFPNTHETLSYLKEKYTLHLISNGFKEACEMKLQRSKLAPYFKTVVISEVVGINKPDHRIFNYALTHSGAEKEQAIMIGDNLDADIRGAMRAGIDAILFNPKRVAPPTDVKLMITDLKELQELF
ncbi:MAG TPA: YjjG family noncanonical pyrimidine nucleotidase [Candidatus Sphingobacterium stercorigallinarum]|nr:YjjG family noncanonical pyrimidine nucleotidase [Candidatus Sphingobacterium stercorigallinarum]